MNSIGVRRPATSFIHSTRRLSSGGAMTKLNSSVAVAPSTGIAPNPARTSAWNESPVVAAGTSLDSVNWWSPLARRTMKVGRLSAPRSRCVAGSPRRVTHEPRSVPAVRAARPRRRCPPTNRTQRPPRRQGRRVHRRATAAEHCRGSSACASLSAFAASSSRGHGPLRVARNRLVDLVDPLGGGGG